MIPKPQSCVGCVLYEPPFGKKVGFSAPCGTGKSGVMIVGEALGEAEEIKGMAFVGRSGETLFQKLGQIGIYREDLTIYNAVACRPPDNKLVKMSYERDAIEKCRPNLDKAISDAKVVAAASGKTFVIVTLGVTAFKRIMELDSKRDADFLKADYIAYPHYSSTYKCWVLAADHPAYLLRGKTQYWPILQFVFKRAMEIAESGLVIDDPDYLLNPTPFLFDEWIEGYRASLKVVPDNPLSYDIETPYKKKTKAEDELGKEEYADHTILRVSFSYVFNGITYTVSVKWSAEFMAGIEWLFAHAPFVLGWNSTNYDHPRVSRYVKINGVDLDGMVAWHILNTSLDKRLGFVTPFYVQNTLMWKHLSDTEPAYYNAKDADMALRNYIGIKKDLITNGLWDVFQEHVIKINEVLQYMTGKGVAQDLTMRQEAEDKLSVLLDGIEARMEEAIPPEARTFKIYKKTPKDTTGMQEIEKFYPKKYCGRCGVEKPTKTHSKFCPEYSVTLINEPMKVWAKPLEFKISKKSMSNYQKSLRHLAIMSREKKITFDADAITLLVKKYPKDPLYPRILEHRKVQKLLSTYVGVTDPVTGRILGGMPTGPDGMIHTTYTHNPSTLRFSSEDPNLQNLPRPTGDPEDLYNIIRNLIIASKGNYLYARDYSGIEAVLTGYFALDPKYIRLAKRDVHTYYTVYALYELEGGARIKAADLPDLDWPDERLFPYLEQLKGQFKKERNQLYKHLVHAANFMQGAKGAQIKIFSETGITYDVKTVQKVMDVYYALFPSIRKWHNTVLEEAGKEEYLRNPFGYVHRFSKVFDWKWEYGEFRRSNGPDVNAAIAFKPQSTAAAIIKEAMLRLYFKRFEEAGQWLRLQVHDELMFDTPVPLIKGVDEVVREEMERPIPQLKMPASWGMGDYLSINTEAKMGERWGGMSERKLNEHLLNR